MRISHHLLIVALIVQVGCGRLAIETITPPSDSVVPQEAVAPTPPPILEASEPRGFQAKRWESASINSIDQVRLDKALARYERTKERYTAIQKMRPTGVPAEIIFTLHGRESTWDFTKHLHEGSPLTGRTKYIPKGRPIHPDPPYTFEQSAEDALYKLKDLENKVNWRSMDRALQGIEAYNGLGYQKYHQDVPSPYLWSGCSIYQNGKYTSDGKFDPLAVDKQLGCATILKWMKIQGSPVSFSP